MAKTVWVSGCCGFVGTHLCRALKEAGWEIWGADCFLEQVHGKLHLPDAHEKASKTIEKGCLYIGVASDGLKALLDSGITPDACVHLAATVGVGQSQYERERYTRMNCLDTDRCLDLLARYGWKGRLIVASSMSVYGEGPTKLQEGSQKGWVSLGKPPVPRGVREDDPLPLIPANHYALTKQHQEASVLCFGEAYEGVTATALRFFNIVGPEQSLNNPYTGVAAMFAARLLHGLGGIVYEDGNQIRSYVSVHDIVDGILLALNAPEEKVSGQVFNLAGNEAHTLLELHWRLSTAINGQGKQIEPVITGLKRKGDVRACFADITKAREVLGYRPRYGLQDICEDYTLWLREQDISKVVSRVEAETENLKARGLLVEG